MTIEPTLQIVGNRKPCKPADQFCYLLTNGLFENYSYDPLRRRDCHFVSIRFLADICNHGLQDGWWLVNGLLLVQIGRILHTWLECDRWAVDLSNGRCLFVPRDDYRSHRSATYVKKMPASQFRQLGVDHDPSLERFLFKSLNLQEIDKIRRAELLERMRAERLHIMDNDLVKNEDGGAITDWTPSMN